MIRGGKAAFDCSRLSHRTAILSLRDESELPCAHLTTGWGVKFIEVPKLGGSHPRSNKSMVNWIDQHQLCKKLLDELTAVQKVIGGLSQCGS